METVLDFIFEGSKITADGDCSYEIKRRLLLGRKVDQPRYHIKKQPYYLANKGPSSQGYGFSSGRLWMWELDCEEGWVPKNRCLWTMVLEKTLESPLDFKEVQPVHPKEISPLPLVSLLFSAICKVSSDNHFAYLHFFFFGMILITTSCRMSQTSDHHSSSTLSIISNPMNLFLTSTV